MADHTATLAINLEDGTSVPALKAKDALKQLQGAIAADTKALAQMQKAFKNLNQGSVVNIEQAQKLRKAMAASKERIAQNQASVLALGGGFKNLAPGAGKAASLLERLSKQAQGMPGPLGGLFSSLQSVGGLLAGGVIAAGIMAIVAALAALVVGTAAAIVMLARYGIAQADAHRSEALRLEGLTKLRFWYRAAAGSASELQSTIDKVSANSAVGRGELVKYTEQLYKMGLRGQNLEWALEGVAIKASTQGEAAAQWFAGMAAGASLTGRSVKALSDNVKARLGGIAARQMLSLTVQSDKLKESMDALFRDVNLEPFLVGLKEVYSLFSQNTVTGRALKFLMETVLQPLIDSVATAAPYMKAFFQGMLLAALKTAIAVIKLRNWFRDTFGKSELFSGIFTLNNALRAGQLLVYAFAAALAGVATNIALIAAPVLLLVAALRWLWKIGTFVVDYFASVDWAAVGAGIAAGISDGLKVAGKAMLANALTDLAKFGLNAFRKAIDSHSPSKKFLALGLTIPQGVEAGVKQGAPRAQRAVGSMIEVPPAPSVPASGGAGGAGGASTASARGPILTIGELHFHAHDQQPREMADDLRRELERVFESLAVSLGAAVPGVV